MNLKAGPLVHFFLSDVLIHVLGGIRDLARSNHVKIRYQIDSKQWFYQIRLPLNQIKEQWRSLRYPDLGFTLDAGIENISAHSALVCQTTFQKISVLINKNFNRSAVAAIFVHK